MRTIISVMNVKDDMDEVSQKEAEGYEVEKITTVKDQEWIVHYYHMKKYEEVYHLYAHRGHGIVRLMLGSKEEMDNLMHAIYIISDNENLKLFIASNDEVINNLMPIKGIRS